MVSKIGLIIASRISVRFSPAVKSGWFQCQFAPISSKAGDNPLNNMNKMLDVTTDAVKQGISSIFETIDTANVLGDDRKEAMKDPLNINRDNITDDTTNADKRSISETIDTVTAVGDSTKEAMETAWEGAKDGAESIKERIKYSGHDLHRYEVPDSGWDPLRADMENAIEKAVEEDHRKN